MGKQGGKRKGRRQPRAVEAGARARARDQKAARRAAARNLPRWKVAVFSLLPAFLLLLSAETVVRLVVSDRPEVTTLPLPEESAGLFEPDPELFWSLIPNLNVRYVGAQVRTDSRGLRNEEIGPKAGNEFRILSLGESSTFGVGVENHETYTLLLESILTTLLPQRTVRAINAGVPAYSSFQSLKYLQERGLELEPDLVLFYHELNDYLPSTLRDSSQHEIGVTMTDKQLYDSRTQWLSRNLMRWSALYRYLVYRAAYRDIQSLNRKPEVDNPLLNVGLPDIGLPPRLRLSEGQEEFTSARSEKSFGQRVSEEERLQILEELVATCAENDIDLIVIHPSYRISRRHECLLTRFCAEHRVAMFEAHDVLHPADLEHQALFRDSWHPNREGHRRLAEALSAFIFARLMTETSD